MPGAIAKGLLLKKAHSRVPAAAERHVATMTPPEFIPVDDRNTGFRKMIYAMAKKVVRPARTSCLTVV